MPHYRRSTVSRLQRIRQLHKRPWSGTVSLSLQRHRLPLRTPAAGWNVPLRHNHNLKTVNTMLLLMAVGVMGVGIFTKDFTLAHGAVASMAFFFAGLSAITSFKVLPKPLSLISIVLGAMTLAALALFSVGTITSGSLTSTEAFDSGFYLGLGPGGMERMIVYPALMWLAGFSGHLITKQETTKATIDSGVHILK
jgi:hypothetical membrane protein